MKNTLTRLFSLVLFLGMPLQAAELRLSGLFTDHTVLQREQPVPVWGWADPDEAITVEFAGQKKAAKADANGKWLVKLDSMPASMEARELVVKSSDEKRESKITDVLVGDVWLCSGQSNMAFRMKTVANAKEEIAAANHPAIRFYRVQDEFSQKPVQDAKGPWKPVAPTNIEECSAVAYYFAVSLRQKYDVPIGLLISSVGGTRIEIWMESETLAALGAAGPLIEKWKNVSPEEFERIDVAYRAYQKELYGGYPQAVRAAKAEGKPVPPEPVRPAMRCHDCPSALHNGMIAPLKPYAIRGVIWYQGEGNAGQGPQYEKLQPALIADWRKTWGEKLPFLFVQIAPHESIPPTFRESQLRTWQATPHTAMAVTLDVGDAKNIHPVWKRPVGQRLALAARALSYGEAIEYSGPVYKSMTVDADRAIVSFTHLGDGLMAKGDALKGFMIAGKDGKFVPADAVIDGQTVVVTSKDVKAPFAVRYAWANVPVGNLFNRDGLPASPFRSDSPADPKPNAEPK